MFRSCDHFRNEENSGQRTQFPGDTGEPLSGTDEPLSDNVGGELVLDRPDAITQNELAFFQPLQLQNVESRRLVQSLYGGIEIAVFLAQARKLVT